MDGYPLPDAGEPTGVGVYAVACCAHVHFDAFLSQHKAGFTFTDDAVMVVEGSHCTHPGVQHAATYFSFYFVENITVCRCWRS